MSRETDQLIDRRRLKRRLRFWRVVAVIAVAAAGIAAYGRVGQDLGVRGDYVAKVAIDGLITRDDERTRTITGVAADDHAKALIVEIDSPGGGFVPSERIYKDLRKVAAKKPVVAVIGNTGASGAYMSALGADYIFVQNGTVTGSIGVILEAAEATDLLKKIGITPEVIKSDPLKAQPNPMEKLSPEARDNLQSVISNLHEAFIDMVADRRGMDQAAARALSDGRVFSGRQAVSNGLVDAIGDLDDARAWLTSARGIDKELPQRDVAPVDKIQKVRKMLGETLGKVLFSERLTLDGVQALWQPQPSF